MVGLENPLHIASKDSVSGQRRPDQIEAERH
jgi:hypothetical protein